MADSSEAPKRDQKWVAVRNDNDYAEDKITVTITLAEYRELVSKAALFDSMDGEAGR